MPKVSPCTILVKYGDDVKVHLIHTKAREPITYLNTVREEEPLTFKWGEYLDPSKFLYKKILQSLI
jgi:hypothetical protein